MKEKDTVEGGDETKFAFNVSTTIKEKMVHVTRSVEDAL
jgi:hypothetical protein